MLGWPTVDDPPKPPAESLLPASSGLLRSQLGDPGRRPELVTALALLDRGDLRGAARVLETSGVHRAAAVIRLEHAAGPNQSNLRRIAMLREGCAQNPGDTDEGKALLRALAEALLRQAETMADGAPMRALLIEAARALEDAERGGEAGMIYERLGLWRQAAQAYEAAGAISNLEYALEIIDRQDAAETAIEAAEKAVDEALRYGHRRLALTLLNEHTSDRFLPTEHRTRLPRLGLVRRMGALEDALPRGHRLHLAWPRGERVTILHSASTLRIGRSPEVEVPLAAPTLSRDHVHLQLAPRLPPAPPGVSLLAVDQGSKVGTFWQGQALEAGVPEPLTTTDELGLGFTSTIEIHPLGGDDDAHGALLQVVGDPTWHLFLPEGGAMQLAPDVRLPATLRWTPPFLEITADPECQLRLNSIPLGPGARIEALLGDRIEFMPTANPDPGSIQSIELLR